MHFVGRRRELALLRRQFESDESSLIPIYGRRRIGKSELILRLLDEHAGIYFVGKEGPAGIQQRELLRIAARFLDEPLLAQVAPEGWKHVFELIEARSPSDRTLVLALDEFQWMAQSSPELVSVLQELWDRSWRDSGRMMLILCGSAIGFMEREVLGQKSPLFGRRTAQIRLRPFGFREARQFHPGYSLTDAAKTYFVCGGVPLYLKAFRADASVEMNVRAAILDEFAPLREEPTFLLREELRDLHNYYAILMALSRGSSDVGAIAAATQIPARSLPYYLNQLVELHYLRKRHPLTPGRPNARNVRYALDDPLLTFWFRFVYPNQSSLRQLGAAATWNRVIEPQLASWMGLAFERLCRGALAQHYTDREVLAPFEIGEYWDKSVQIDVVGVRDDGWVDIGECKWGSVRSPSGLVDELERKRTAYPNPTNATIGLHAFVRDRPRSVPEGDVVWHDLKSMYAEP